MLLFVVIAIMLIFLARKHKPELVALSFPAYFSFLKVMAMISFIRIFTFMVYKGEPSVSIDLFNFPSLFLVFWEDMFFVFPSLLLYSLTKNKYLTAPVMLVSSVIFASGHIYQSVPWALILLGYVPLMFYFGRKYGLGTVMASHVTYDVVTYLTLALMASGVL